MATRELSEWSMTDASNNFTPEEGGWAEGMKRSDVNDAARADMGAIRRWYDDPEWLDLTVGATLDKITATAIRVNSGDYTAYFGAGRRVRMTGGTPSPVDATVTASQVLGGQTFVGLTDFSGHTEVPTAPTAIYSHITSSIQSASFLDPVILPVTLLTDAGIQTAIDALEADGGGIIALEPGATYTISNTLTVGLGTSEGNIRIIGRGAILQADASLDDEILDIQDAAAGVIDANVTLEDVIFDGNSANQTVASAGIAMLSIGANVSNVWVRRCTFRDSYGDCVGILPGCHKVWIENSIFEDMGEDGIFMTDSSNNIDQIVIRGCSFDTPCNTAGITTGAGIHFAGKVQIENCNFINMDHGTDTQIGIWGAVKAAASPTDQSGRESSIVGCRFEGTGANARGIYLQGRDCTVDSCHFDFSGVGTEGVQVEYAGNEAERHVIKGCNFQNVNRAIRFQASAQDCIAQGNVFNGCAYCIYDTGLRNKILSNVMYNGTFGITVDSGADDTMVALNTIDTMSSDCIIVVSGATRVQVVQNITNNPTGSHLTDGGTDTGIIGGYSNYELEFALATSITAFTTGVSTETLVSDGAGNDYLTSFNALADSDREWIVSSCYIQGKWGATDGSIAPIILRLRHGTNSGTPTSDTEICRQQIQFGAAGSATSGVWVDDGWSVSFPEVVFTPASGDDIYLTAESANNADLDFLGSDVSYNAYFRVRPR